MSYNIQKPVNELFNRYLRKHVHNKYTTFELDFYAIKEDGSCVKSESSIIFEDMSWGMIIVHYCPGINYKGFFDSKKEKLYISKDGIISDSLQFGNLIIKSDQIETIDGTTLYSPIIYEIEDVMVELNKVLPYLHGCRTMEEANMLLEIRNLDKKEQDDRREIIDTLIEEIKRLKGIVSEYEEKFDEIKTILLDKKDNNN